MTGVQTCALPILLESDSAETQLFAAYSLAGIGPDAAAALPALERLLQSPDPDMQTVARETIDLVKMPEELWFQNEWKYAQRCADKYGFELIKIGTPDGEKVLSAIDNLTKGSSGQALQNFNLAFGLEEQAGLHLVTAFP